LTDIEIDKNNVVNHYHSNSGICNIDQNSNDKIKDIDNAFDLHNLNEINDKSNTDNDLGAETEELLINNSNNK